MSATDTMLLVQRGVLCRSLGLGSGVWSIGDDITDSEGEGDEGEAQKIEDVAFMGEWVPVKIINNYEISIYWTYSVFYRPPRTQLYRRPKWQQPWKTQWSLARSLRGIGRGISICIGTKYGCLTHWSRVTHICVGKLTIIGSDNGLSPVRRQAIIWTNDGILLIEPLGTNFSEILIAIKIFSFKKMRLKMSSAKWRPFCLGLNVLTTFVKLPKWVLWWHIFGWK